MERPAAGDQVARAAALRSGCADWQRVLALGGLRYPAHGYGAAAGCRQQCDDVAGGRFRRHHRFPGHRRDGGNGNYGGPCPPQGDPPHRYIFTLFALAVDKLEVAGGVPKTGTAGLYGFVLNKGLGSNLLGKATFTATYGR